MTYSTLMVHLELGKTNAGLLQAARDLAQRFEAGIIGIAAYQPMLLLYSDGAAMSGDLFEHDQAQNEAEMKAAEAEFRTAFQGRTGFLEWRSTVTYAPLSDYLACEARSADLFITGVTSSALLSAAPPVSTGDLIMQLGRPALIVPSATTTLHLDRVVVAWKDTRETRRAALDALPLLQKAGHVSVVGIAAEQDLPATRAQLNDVAGWLKRHVVRAECYAEPSIGNDAERLDAIAHELSADIVVAGAYGHNRVREWAFGGVTRDLLLRSDRCSLLSH